MPLRISALLFALTLALPSAGLAESLASLGGLKARVGAGVSEAEIATITEALSLAETYFSEELGLPHEALPGGRWRVEVVATGRGNPLGRGDRACCTAVPASLLRGPRIFLDVGHVNWQRSSPFYARPQDKHMQLVLHEYAHAVQSGFEGRAGDARMPAWLAEGMAEYLAYDAMIRAGRMQRADVERFVASRARRLGGFSQPLGGSAAVWPGHIGYLAVAGLVREAGASSPLTYLRAFARTGDHDSAFTEAFGQTPAAFGANFERYRLANRQRPMPQTRWN